MVKISDKETNLDFKIKLTQSSPSEKDDSRWTVSKEFLIDKKEIPWSGKKQY